MTMPGSPNTATLRSRLLDPADTFAITPMPALDDARLGSVNLRLGRTFLVARRASVPFIDAQDTRASERLFDEVRLPSDEALVLQPQQFVLAATLEYLSMPPDLCGFIQSRSTYGRLGLIAATATYVTAGYHGCPTLEIVNAGEVPVRIRPGEDICQLVLLTADEDPQHMQPSRYQCAVRPYPARRV